MEKYGLFQQRKTIRIKYIYVAQHLCNFTQMMNKAINCLNLFYIFVPVHNSFVCIKYLVVLDYNCLTFSTFFVTEQLPINGEEIDIFYFTNFQLETLAAKTAIVVWRSDIEEFYRYQHQVM